MLERMRDWGYDSDLGLARAGDTQALDGATAMGLLACVDYARLAFSINSLPAIRPVNHVVDDGRIIIRTSSTGAVSVAARSLDGVMVEGQPARARRDRLDNPMAAENSRRGNLLSPGAAGRKPEGQQRQCESRERSHAPPLDGHGMENLYLRGDLRKRQFVAARESPE